MRFSLVHVVIKCKVLGVKNCISLNLIVRFCKIQCVRVLKRVFSEIQMHIHLY